LGGARLSEAGTEQLGRRRHRRWPINKRLTVVCEAQAFRARAYDLSVSGVGLLMPARLRVGWVVQISDGRHHAWIPTRVVHVSDCDKRGLYPTGLEFVRPQEPSASGAGE
jgi:c-di-GMP-binding flagellar brake protein YcgR